MAASMCVLAPVVVENNEAVCKTLLKLGNWAPNKDLCKLLISEIGRTNAHPANKIIAPAMASPRAQDFVEIREERECHAVGKLYTVIQMA